MFERTPSVLTGIVFLPFVWALVGLFIPTRLRSGQIFLKVWTLLGALATFLLSLVLLEGYVPNGPEFQFAEQYSWISFLGISYAVGIDGFSLWLILLTTFLLPIVILSSWKSVETRLKTYYFLLLSLETAILGAFVALDVFLFYVFWEAMLIPMYFLIGIWGGKERIYAAMKLFLFTLVGSLLMLVAIFYMASEHHVQWGVYSTLLADLHRVHLLGGHFFSPQSLLFLAFTFAFMIKVPLFPLHTWLPDAHVQAPTAGSVILAAILLKIGGYGLLRFAFPLFPEAVVFFQYPLLFLGAVAILYGACVALVQPDLKKLVAYSSVSHMGYVILGIVSLNEIAVTGAIYQMLNHGISTGALFLLVGMIYERRHTREISALGGLARIMPLFAVALMITTLSSIGLPGTNGFVGEFLILLGTWKVSPPLAVLGALGVIFGAVYMLWMYQRVMLGPLVHSENKVLSDLSLREGMLLLPLIVLIFVMGIFPNFFFEKIEPTLHRWVLQSSPQLTDSPEVSKKSQAARPVAAQLVHSLTKGQ